VPQIRVAELQIHAVGLIHGTLDFRPGLGPEIRFHHGIRRQD
jgi:hypothetical protein